MNKVLLHSFASKLVAEYMLKVVASRIGNGGKNCYEINFVSGLCHGLFFLPETFEKLHSGFPLPDTKVLDGFIQGYMTALGSAEITRLAQKSM